MDFVTTDGGGVRSLSIEGGVTGLGADYIIIDDPVEIKDCDNTKCLERKEALLHVGVIGDEDNRRHRWMRALGWSIRSPGQCNNRNH